MTKVILETERLRLREFEPDDAPHVREMLADDEARYTFRHLVDDPDFPERWIERNRARYREDGFGLWAAEAKATGEFVGDCGLTRQWLGDERLLEVGYHLTLAARGHGYATEAAAACLRYAFDHLQAPRVYSMVDLENTASQHVAARIHTRREAGFEKHGRPIYLYSTERCDL